MAEQSPLTAGEMLSVNGVGTRKLERFGKEFMALIRAHVDGDDGQPRKEDARIVSFFTISCELNMLMLFHRGAVHIIALMSPGPDFSLFRKPR